VTVLNPRLAIFGSILLLLADGACATLSVPEFDLYVVPRDTFDLRGKRIALVPLSVPSDIENPEPVVAGLDYTTEHFLRSVGADLVPASEYRKIWNRLTAEAGGFFDPFTGQRDEPKYQAGVRQLMKEMHRDFHPDAFLYPELWVVEAPVMSGTARWDGTSQEFGPAVLGVEVALALTIAVVVEDSSGNELFANGRGLQLLERFDADSDEIEMIPRDELFQDAEMMSAAVFAVLSPLLAVLSDTLPS